MQRVWLLQAGLHWPEIQRGFPLEPRRGSLSASWERIGKMLSAEHTYSIFSSSWLQAREHKWQCIINCCSSGFLSLRISRGEGGEVSWVLSTSMSFPSEVPAVPWEAGAVPVWLSGRRAVVAVQTFLTKVLCLFLSMCWYLGPVITVSIAFTDALWNNVWNEVFWVEEAL